MKQENIGTTFDSWLHEEGIYEETSTAVRKRVAARKTGTAMQFETGKDKELEIVRGSGNVRKAPRRVGGSHCASSRKR